MQARFSLFKLFIGIVFTLSLQEAQAELFTPIFRNYTTIDGLPSSQIYQVKQDSRGYVWFATDNGISKFDGNEFTNYTYSNGLCVRTLFGIYEDANDRIWFYSFSGELVYFDHNDQKMHCPDFNTELVELTRGTLLNGIFGEENIIYTYDYYANLYRIDLKNDSVSVERNMGELKIGHYPSGGILFGYLNKVELDSFKLSYSHFSESISKQELKFDLPYEFKTLPSIIYHPDLERYFFSINEKLYEYQAKQNAIQEHVIDFAGTQSLYVDKKGLIWVGSYTKGVYAFKKQGNELKQVYHFLADQMITSIWQDRQDGYWFTSHESGVYYTPSLAIEGLEKDLSNSFDMVSQVSVIKSKDSIIVFANAKGQIARLNTNTKDNLELIGNEGRNFNLLFLQSDKYLKSEDILHSRSDKSVIFTLRDYLEIEENGFALINRGNQLELVNILNKKLRFKTSYPLNSVRVLQLTYKYNCYMGNNYKLLFFDSENNVWLETEGLSDKYNSVDVASITPWMGDSVWVATRNRGVLLVCRNQVLLEINKTNGFPIDFCNDVKFDQGILYVSTNEGIIQVKSVFSSPEINFLSMGSGLISKEIFESLRLSNYLYLATNEGLCRIDTGLFQKKSPDFKSLIEAIWLDTTWINKNLKFRMNQEEELQIKYVANSYENAFFVPFRYRLKADDEWNYTRENKLRITNLGPANYSFEVQAANADGIFGESAKFEFIVNPKIWQTGWFLLLSIFITIIIASLIFGYRLKQTKKLSTLKGLLIQSQNRALSSQMNPHFIFNSLNSITHGLLNNDVRTSVLYIGKFGKLMRSIFENSEETFIPLSEELLALKNYLELEKLRLQEKLRYTISINPEVKTDQIYIPALLLQPFVENSIWHGIAPLLDNSGLIQIEISKTKENLQILIQDNGIGFSKKNDGDRKEKSAIRIAEKRLELIEQIYKRKILFKVKPLDSSAENKGTQIELILPIITSKP